MVSCFRRHSRLEMNFCAALLFSLSVLAEFKATQEKILHTTDTERNNKLFSLFTAMAPNNMLSS